MGFGYGRGFQSDQGIYGRSPDGKRRVFDTYGVCKAWAAQETSEGRNHKGSVYFKGKTIYSYGRHWPMATIIERRARDGRRIAIVRTWEEKYGVATFSHTREARSRFDGLKVECSGETLEAVMRNEENVTLIGEEKVAQLASAAAKAAVFKRDDGDDAERRISIIMGIESELRDEALELGIALPAYDLDAMVQRVRDAYAKWMEGYDRREKARKKREAKYAADMYAALIRIANGAGGEDYGMTGRLRRRGLLSRNRYWRDDNEKITESGHQWMREYEASLNQKV